MTIQSDDTANGTITGITQAPEQTDVLAKWDAGEPVWSCEMGGMGPGYEQCIQLMAFEMYRAMLAKAPDWSTMTGEAGRGKWRAFCDEIDAVPEVKNVISSLGVSGAQHGAAMGIASKFAMDGYDDAIKSIPQDRKILVSKNFPSLSVTG